MDDFNFFSAYFLCVFQVYKIFTPMFSNKTNQFAFSQGGTGLGADSSLETAYSFSCIINLDSKSFPFPVFLSLAHVLSDSGSLWVSLCYL